MRGSVLRSDSETSRSPSIRPDRWPGRAVVVGAAGPVLGGQPDPSGDPVELPAKPKVPSARRWSCSKSQSYQSPSWIEPAHRAAVAAHLAATRAHATAWIELVGRIPAPPAPTASRNRARSSSSFIGSSFVGPRLSLSSLIRPAVTTPAGAARRRPGGDRDGRATRREARAACGRGTRTGRPSLRAGSAARDGASASSAKPSRNRAACSSWIAASKFCGCWLAGSEASRGPFALRRSAFDADDPVTLQELDGAVIALRLASRASLNSSIDCAAGSQTRR